MSGIINRVLSASDLLHQSNRPVPTAPDGLTDAEAAGSMEDPNGIITKALQQIKDMMQTGAPIGLASVPGLLNALQNPNAIDDSKMLLEKLIVFMAKMDAANLDAAKKLQNLLITFLHEDLPHPPSTFVEPYAKREADGSKNNLACPFLGQARTSYARSVQSRHTMPVSSLPDAGLVFDTLLRREKFHPHPSGLSSFFFAFASLVIHNLFFTDRITSHINTTSSYLDMAPLYGRSQEEQDRVRRVDGRGQLHEDTFADTRMVLMAPALTALTVLFSRNHNYIATHILSINEARSFKDPQQIKDSEKLRAQDDEIFNRARLVNCGMFMSAILGDYIPSILGLNKLGSDWELSPLQEIRSVDHKLVPRALGNCVSIEFNLLYRWHATLSEADVKRTEKTFKDAFPSKDFEELTPEEFNSTINKLAKVMEAKDPREWEFGGIRRKSGRFLDEDLARIIQDAIDEPAAAYRARGTPTVMKVVEVISINNARKWGACTLNEFRKFMGLRPYSTFKEWNHDEDVAIAAERLYGHIDNLELYVGMQAEQPKTPIPGAGLCPGFTISRAILADAVSLTRGDRFFTADFTPQNLTAWGYQDCYMDHKTGSHGGVLNKLLFRTLPNQFTENSVYAHYPLTTPAMMKGFLEDQRKVNEYDFERHPPRAPVKVVETHAGVEEVLKDIRGRFKSPYDENMDYLTKGQGLFLSIDRRTQFENDWKLVHKALFPPGALDRIASWYADKTTELIDTKFFTMSKRPGRSEVRGLDVVRDVINLVPVYWLAQVIGLPLKTKETPQGTLTPQEFYRKFASLFRFIYLNILPDHGWILRNDAKSARKDMLHYIKAHFRAISASTLSLEKLTASVRDWLSAQSSDDLEFLNRLRDTERPTKELKYIVLGVLIASTVNHSHAFTNILDFYLDNERDNERQKIIELSQRPWNPDVEKALVGYVREALRLRPQCTGTFRDAQTDMVIEGQHISQGDRIFLSIGKANTDPEVFSAPDVVNPGRPKEPYLLSDSMHTSLSDLFIEKTMTRLLRTIFRLKNIRRAPGESGKLDQFTQDLHGTEERVYLDTTGKISPWPTSLIIHYEPEFA